ncbi:hypothetical protein J6590_034036 [Homalodisca vitripennis]|nr:hypothetical protein J6590_034036 [Homalodisca vitripennis]
MNILSLVAAEWTEGPRECSAYFGRSRHTSGYLGTDRACHWWNTCNPRNLCWSGSCIAMRRSAWFNFSADNQLCQPTLKRLQISGNLPSRPAAPAALRRASSILRAARAHLVGSQGHGYAEFYQYQVTAIKKERHVTPPRLCSREPALVLGICYQLSSGSAPEAVRMSDYVSLTPAPGRTPSNYLICTHQPPPPIPLHRQIEIRRRRQL